MEDGHTLDVAISVVLTTGFCVESVLVASETAAVEAKFVCIGNETIIICELVSMEGYGPWDVTYATACEPLP
jgi:hypothetical protein